METKISARDKLLQAVLDMLAEGRDVSLATTRQIAARAGVNAALVNYYYQSRENLLSHAVALMMEGVAGRIAQSASPQADAASRLGSMLAAMGDAAFQNANVCKIAIATELKRGCRDSCEMILPLLKELFPQCGREELMSAALQLMLPLHHIMLEPGLYGEVLGADFTDARQRARTIDRMVGRVLAGITGKTNMETQS